MTPHLNPDSGGAERVAYELVNELSKSNSITVVSELISPTRFPENVRFVPLKMLRLPRGVFPLYFLLCATSAVLRLCIAEDFDVVHVIGVHFGGYLGVFARRRSKLFIQTLAGMEILRSNQWLFALTYIVSFRFPDCVIIPNSFQAGQVRGVKSTNLRYIPHGVKVPSIGLCGPQTDPPILCTVSRLSHSKRVDLILKAASILKERRVSFRLKIVGDGELAGQLKKLSKALMLENEIEFAGSLRHDAAMKAVCESSCYISASEWEGFGLSIAEAVSLAKPVVSTYWTGIEYLVEDGKNGLVVCTDDPRSIALAVESVLKDDELMISYGRYSATLSSRRFLDWVQVAEAYDLLYRREVRRKAIRNLDTWL